MTNETIANPYLSKFDTVEKLEQYLFLAGFGDGLMVIRKLFGSAFAGDALTAKAISADATRNTDEIHEYITAMTTVDPIG